MRKIGGQDVGRVKLRARREDVQDDAILVRDLGNGRVYLHATSRGRDFDWDGSAVEALERLSGLPKDAGPEAVRSEFAR